MKKERRFVSPFLYAICVCFRDVEGAVPYRLLFALYNFLILGPSGTPVPTRFVYAIVETDVLGGPFFHQTILKLEFSIYFFADMCYNQIDE